MKYGFVPSQIIEGVHYLMGDGNIDFPSIMPLGHGWANYLPAERIQNLNGIETDACTTFAFIDALSALFKRTCNLPADWSDRYMAIVSGTTPNGNDPQTIAESARTFGVIDYSLLPFDPSINTLDKFFAPKPMTESYLLLGKQFLEKYEIGHAWIGTQGLNTAQIQELMKKGLESSPLSVAVYAWLQGQNGVYINPQNLPPCHDVCIYDYIEGQYWMAFDSYDQTHKLLDWNFPFSQIKVYAIRNASVKSSSRMWQLAWIKTLANWILSEIKALSTQTLNTMTEDTTQVTSTPIAPVSEVYLWDTPVNARHSVRVICDEQGLTGTHFLGSTYSDKDILTACVQQESQFDIKAINHNKDPRTGEVLSTDYGICQINDFYHIGPGKDFESVDEVLNQPEKSVRYMTDQLKKGHLNLWVSFSTGAYKKWL